jgi:hypothetical protein
MTAFSGGDGGGFGRPLYVRLTFTRRRPISPDMMIRIECTCATSASRARDPCRGRAHASQRASLTPGPTDNLVISVTVLGAEMLRVHVVRVAQEDAMNATKQQHTHQRAAELDELGWRWALKLADLDRREYKHKQPVQTSHALPSAFLNVTVRPTLH